MEQQHTIVIIGAGQAGGWAARTLRAEGYAGRVLLCGDETAPPYERPPLSKEQLAAQAPPLPSLMDAAQLAELRIEWRGGAAATRIDRAARQVLLDDGRALPYDALILCTGGRPRLPPLPGADLSCVHTLRTIGDAARLRAAFDGGPRVAVLGGGWIGLEVAAAARQRGCAVVLLEAADRLCARSGPGLLSETLARLHAGQGVDLRLNARVRRIEASGRGGLLVLADGQRVEADIVVAGVGLVRNDELARQAGLACDQGVIVDGACRTSDPDIYAAGDVAVMAGPDGKLAGLESWQNAQDQGIAAARAALGQAVRYAPLPFFWSQQYDTLVQMAGASEPGAELVLRQGAPAQLLCVEMRADGRPAAVLGVNAAREFRQLRKYIAEGARLDARVLADPRAPLAGALLRETAA
ncbi:pyridine nucleotide-disulfide oxidoreductase [Bordetella bronchiseptica 99-R-0433]|uniref:NAD(P)/FAD-dependent oxidoreductase n=1 Tax=Bordetella bronchiseptica TaxID=518 RepID=UPI000459D792|nr:FAD-dependent oxidoreductase [Bordetella bronchiseptica]KCV65676.1 pyridine nucleotide-disulfide oxidoreductase [Bordetella bronchiseptica 99-R-0433]